MSELTTKEKIIEATLQIASEKGLGKTSLSDIASVVGIKKPSIYNYFNSKDDLIIAVYENFYKYAEQKNPKPGTGRLEDAIVDLGVKGTLMMVAKRYFSIHEEEKISRLRKVLEAEKYYNETALKIILDEYRWVKENAINLFKLFEEKNVMKFENLEVAATIYANTFCTIISNARLYKELDKNISDWETQIDQLTTEFCRIYKI